MMIAIQTLIIVVTIVLTWRAATALQRRRELAAVEKTVYFEIASMRLQARALAAELTHQHESGLPLGAAFFSIWRLSKPLLYPTIGYRIGLLEPSHLLDRVGYFHTQLAEARERVTSVVMSDGVIDAPYRLLSNLLRASNYVEAWLDLMEARYGDPIMGASVDVGKANALLEALEAAPGEPKVIAYCWTDTCSPDRLDLSEY